MGGRLKRTGDTDDLSGMDGQMDALRRERAELLVRSERLRLWSRLVRARTDLLTAQLCPPTSDDEDGARGDDELTDLAALVLDTQVPAGPGDRVQHLLALREARRALSRRRDALDDELCWSAARLVLAGPVGPGTDARGDVRADVRADGGRSPVRTSAAGRGGRGARHLVPLPRGGSDADAVTDLLASPATAAAGHQAPA